MAIPVDGVFDVGVTVVTCGTLIPSLGVLVVGDDVGVLDDSN